MELSCKGCQKIITKENSRMVGNWYFCCHCFQNFLQDQGEKKSQAGRQPFAQCHTCEQEIVDENYHELGGLKFCLHCYTALTSCAKLPELASESGLQEEQYIVPQIEMRPGAMSNKRCQGCNRRLIERAYRIIRGHPYCPDCYYQLPEFSHANKMQQEDIELPEGAKKCQSCMRELPGHNLQIVEGFDICQACLASDADSALQIARGKHRQHLLKLKKEVELNEKENL